MLSDERILALFDQCKTESHTPTERGEWAKTVAPEYRMVGNYTTVKFARTIEREATAEAVRLLELSLLGLDCAAKCESPEFLAHVLAGDAIREYLGRMK